MRRSISMLAMLVLVLSFIAGCDCLAATATVNQRAKSIRPIGRATVADTTKATGRHKGAEFFIVSLFFAGDLPGSRRLSLQTPIVLHTACQILPLKRGTARSETNNITTL